MSGIRDEVRECSLNIKKLGEHAVIGYTIHEKSNSLLIICDWLLASDRRMPLMNSTNTNHCYSTEVIRVAGKAFRLLLFSNGDVKERQEEVMFFVEARSHTDLKVSFSAYTKRVADGEKLLEFSANAEKEKIVRNDLGAVGVCLGKTENLLGVMEGAQEEVEQSRRLPRFKRMLLRV